MPSNSKSIKVRVNGSNVFFQAGPFRKGHLKLDDCSSEQCEACGTDICEATIVGTDEIRCASCGMDYSAHAVAR